MLRTISLTVLCGVATGAALGFFACEKVAEYALERLAKELHS